MCKADGKGRCIGEDRETREREERGKRRDVGVASG